MTKKLFYIVIAAALICGATAFTSCTNDDNPVTPDLGVKEKIIGKWMVSERGGQPALTNEKMVINFVSTTKAYVSASLGSRPEVGTHWIEKQEVAVAIYGNKMTVTMHPDEHTTTVEEYNVTAISNNELNANLKITITVDGNQVMNDVNTVCFTKVTADYSADIIGMWEGHSTGEEGSEFDDGENHRWEYMTDGSFNYFRKVDGQWQISDDYAYYFVDGNLLCTRWKNAGAGNEEHREWWEIESIEDGVMKWKALRQKEDGTTYTATFEMTKVN